MAAIDTGRAGRIGEWTILDAVETFATNVAQLCEKFALSGPLFRELWPDADNDGPSDFAAADERASAFVAAMFAYLASDESSVSVSSRRPDSARSPTRKSLRRAMSDHATSDHDDGVPPELVAALERLVPLLREFVERIEAEAEHDAEWQAFLDSHPELAA